MLIEGAGVWDAVVRRGRGAILIKVAGVWPAGCSGEAWQGCYANRGGRGVGCSVEE